MLAGSCSTCWRWLPSLMLSGHSVNTWLCWAVVVEVLSLKCIEEQGRYEIQGVFQDFF